MKEIDAVVDNKPTTELIIELAKLRIRNLDAFRELQALNDTNEFLYKHPLIKHFSLRAKLEELLKNNPGEFMDSYNRAKDNVKRYTSFIKSDKRTSEQKKNDKLSLKKWKEESDIYINVLDSRK